MVDNGNIYNILNEEIDMKLPDNKDEIYREIISLVKKHNLSFVQIATIFNTVVKKLAYTPINEL